MEKRFEGFLAPHGLYILDTFTGEVRFIHHAEDSNFLNKSPEGINVSAALIEQKNNQPSLSSFENEVVSSYPYLIAKPFADLLNEKDARMKCKLMVDTFTAVLKYLALQLASEYLRANDVKDIQVHQTLTKDLSRPLISAWNLLIARCLPVLSDHKVTLFSPEIKAAYEKLESKCKDPKLVEQKYSDENGEIKTKTKKLGKIQALINYRNGLAHGFNQSQSRAQKEFDEYYPLLCDILQEVRFVSRYTLWHVESNRQGVNGMRLMGASPTLTKIDFDREGINPAISPLFLINDGSGEILPLYAFFDVDDAVDSGLPDLGKDIFVFEGNTKNTVIYLSSSGEHLEKTSRFQHWKELLAQKQFDVEWADSKNLSLEILNSIGKYISASAIQALIASGKYLPEASIPRKDLNEMLDAFSYGTFNGFVLGGESGIGKSTLLAKKTEEWQSEGHMVAFYRGSALNQSDIANKFLRDCALKVSYMEDFLSLANPLFSNSDKKCYLIIDALNEYAGELNELIQSVNNIVAQSSNFPWFKIIVSIRDSAYNRANIRFGELIPNKYFTVEEEKGGEKVRTNIIRLQPVTKDHVEQLYNAYRDYKWKDSADTDAEGYYKFRPLTTFSELNAEGSTINLIRSPLMARLIMQSFHRSRLPLQLSNDDAMRLYYDNIVLEKTDHQPGFPERKKLLTLLVSEMDKASAERLERDELMKIPAIRNYLIGTQKDNAYIQLLDLGVLMEEWEADECYLRFAFDKFLEFLLAELHWPRIFDSISLMTLCKRAISFKILHGAIEIIIVRLCVNNQHNILTELFDIASNEPEPEKLLIKDLGVRILYTLCIENQFKFENIIEDFPKNPGMIDLIILNELLEKLYTTGNLNVFEKTMSVAIFEAESLEENKILSDLLLIYSQYDMLKGNYNESRQKILKAIDLKQELNDIYGLLLAYEKLAGIDWRMGDIESSLLIYEKSLLLSKEKNYKDLTATFLNKIGSACNHKGKIKEAETNFLESLKIYIDIGDNKGRAMSSNYLAVLYKNQGRLSEAENLLLGSLAIYRESGEKLRICDTMNSLAILYKVMGKYEEAERLHLETMDIYEKFGAIKGISVVQNNLGNLYLNIKRYEDAEKLLLASLDIKRRLGLKQGISNSIGSLANVSKALCKYNDSLKLHVESLEIRRQLNDKKGIGITLGSLGVVSFELSNDSGAINYFKESIEIKRELLEKDTLLATIHRAFSIFEPDDREKLFNEVQQIDNKDFRDKEHCWLLNIELMHSCLNKSEINTAEILSLSDKILELSAQIKLNDIDDLPVEAFYIATHKLTELTSTEAANKLAKIALGWIGDRKTRRKADLEKIVLN